MCVTFRQRKAKIGLKLHMNKKSILKFIILIMTICMASCILFACNEKPASPNPTPTPEPELPAEPLFYEEKEGYAYGEDIEITYFSNITNTERKAYVTLPANYDETKAYPVLYLLHGMSCTYKSWLSMCNAKYVLQNLQIEGDAAAMIVVSVDSNITSGTMPSIFSEDYCTMFDKTADEIVTSIMPYVNEHYSTLTDRTDTAIAGFSMGGRETLLTAFKYQDYFNYVGAFSPSGFGDKPVSFDTTVLDFRYEDGKIFDVVMLAIGNLDTSTSLFYPHIDSKLTQNNIAHLSKKYAGGHDQSVWRNALYDFAKMIFVEN